MEGTIHTMTNLFAQLGLPSAPADIKQFISSARPLPATLALHEAPFWSKAQAQFLCEQKLADADWAEIIDSLDTSLR